MTSEAPPLLVVFSGPSGAGKDTVLARLRERGERFARPVTMTTRPPREGEVDGVHYYFRSEQDFQRAVKEGELLEHARVHEHDYGLPRASLGEALSGGVDVIVQVDVQGAQTLRPLLPGHVSIFLVPDDLAKLEARLRERGADEQTVRNRLDSARAELATQGAYDHVLVNVDGDLDGTVDRLVALLAEERSRPGHPAVEV